MNQVAKKEPEAVAVSAQSEAVALMGIIERAARDPNVDIVKMRELLAMRKELSDEAAKIEFNSAMALAQAEMSPIAADCNNKQTKSKYASYFALDKALRPIYSRHGFDVGFNTADGAPADHVRVVLEVTRGGYSRKYQADMPADGKGAKGGDVMTKTHAVVAGISYGQSKLLKMAFNIAVGEDNDGNAPGDTGEKISEKQADDIRDLLESTGASTAKFLKWAKVANITDIPAAHFDSCVTAIKNVQKVAS